MTRSVCEQKRECGRKEWLLQKRMTVTEESDCGENECLRLYKEPPLPKGGMLDDISLRIQ